MKNIIASNNNDVEINSKLWKAQEQLHLVKHTKILTLLVQCLFIAQHGAHYKYERECEK